MDASEALQYMAAVLNELQAENARLREALEKQIQFIADLKPLPCGMDAYELIDIAKAALGKE